MNKDERVAAIQSGLPDVAEKWLQDEKLLEAGERVYICITILPPNPPLVEVSAKVKSKPRATPKSRINPNLSNDDWEKILGYRWENEDRVVLEMLKARKNATITRAEVAAQLGVRDWVSVINDSRITGRLKKMGLDDLRLLHHGSEGANTRFCIYRMV